MIGYARPSCSFVPWDVPAGAIGLGRDRPPRTCGVCVLSSGLHVTRPTAHYSWPRVREGEPIELRFGYLCNGT
jgi:hypothetical protein